MLGCITILSASEYNRLKFDVYFVACCQTVSTNGEHHVTSSSIVSCSCYIKLNTTRSTTCLSTVNGEGRILLSCTMNCFLSDETDISIDKICSINITRKLWVLIVRIIARIILFTNTETVNEVFTETISHGQGCHISCQFVDVDRCLFFAFNMLQ